MIYNPGIHNGIQPWNTQWHTALEYTMAYNPGIHIDMQLRYTQLQIFDSYELHCLNIDPHGLESPNIKTPHGLDCPNIETPHGLYCPQIDPTWARLSQN